MKTLTFTVLAEGGSDRLLIPVIEWMIRSLNTSFAYEVVLAELYTSSDLINTGRMKEMLRVYPCDVLIIHRDSDTQKIQDRRNQIANAAILLNAEAKLLPVIPVRMTEAWFLGETSAIKAAVGNPHGNVALKLPPKLKWEKLPDPKRILLDLLIQASELNGRRLKRFNPHDYRARVGELIEDFSYLRGLSSFDQFEADMKQTLEEF